MRTFGYAVIGAGVLILPYYFKRNGVMGAVLLGLSLLSVWQRVLRHAET
jgi:amino acid permease